MCKVNHHNDILIRIIKRSLEKAGIPIYRGSNDMAEILQHFEEVFLNNHPLYLRHKNIQSWLADGRIYVTDMGMNPENLLHAYSHLWLDSLCLHNPTEWDTIKGLVRDSLHWDLLLGDVSYSDTIKNEDKFLTEILVRSSEKNNVELLRSQLRIVLKGNSFVTDDIDDVLLHKIKKSIDFAWSFDESVPYYQIAYKSMDHITIRILYDLVRATSL